MISKCQFITSEEEKLIERIASDLQSGNHLIRPRDDKYWAFFDEMVAARNAEINGNATDKQKEMLEYGRQSSDYFYWKHLPQDKRLFLEEDEDGDY
jgi:hypothetical protein